jgi:OmpA-OmpF porin, OOP family
MQKSVIAIAMIMAVGAAGSVAQVRHFSESDLPSADDVTRLLGGGSDQPAPKMRGLRVSPSPTANAPAAAAGQALQQRDEPKANVSAGGFSFPVAFALGSATLSPSAYGALDRIGAGMAALTSKDPDVKILIEGHADASGEFNQNVQLSLRRALAVKSYLMTKYGIDQNNLEVAGMGSRALLNQGNPMAAENRRVEFKRVGQ